MDLMFILSAAIFTLLAIVIATSLLSGSSDKRAKAQAHLGHREDGSGSDASEPKHSGHAPEKKRKTAENDWCETSWSAHDHWDVVKSVQSVNRLPLSIA